MARKLLTATGLIFVLVLSLPMFAYWWGLSQIDGLSQPIDLNLTEVEEKEVWLNAKEVGKPRLRKMSAYSYLLMIKCGINCKDKYPGVGITAQAIRSEVSSKLEHGNSTHWQFTWMAYTIWATRNWTLDEVISTYKATRA
ncbi:hypothetical protein ACVBEJ_12385 [Porticoccus sp. GXU_MW_L64]